MNDMLMTLETFFQFDDEHAARTEDLNALGSAEQMGPVKKALRKQAGKHAWPAVSSELYSQIGKLLDISLGDILVKAWNETKLLDRFLNPPSRLPFQDGLSPGSWTLGAYSMSNAMCRVNECSLSKTAPLTPE